MPAQQHGQRLTHMFLVFGDKDGRFVGVGSHIVSVDDSADGLPMPTGYGFNELQSLREASRPKIEAAVRIRTYELRPHKPKEPEAASTRGFEHPGVQLLPYSRR